MFLFSSACVDAIRVMTYMTKKNEGYVSASLSDTEICDMEAGCVKIEGEWKCRLGFGLLTTSYVELTFNTRTGELNNIDFDKDKAPKFKNSEFWEGWLSNSTEERIKEIQSLL